MLESESEWASLLGDCDPWASRKVGGVVTDRYVASACSKSMFSVSVSAWVTDHPHQIHRV